MEDGEWRLVKPGQTWEDGEVRRREEHLRFRKKDGSRVSLHGHRSSNVLLNSRLPPLLSQVTSPMELELIHEDDLDDAMAEMQQQNPQLQKVTASRKKRATPCLDDLFIFPCSSCSHVCL